MRCAMNSFLIVFLGAGIGGVMRHAVNLVVPRVLGAEFPYHTLTVNIAGSLVMGLLAGLFVMRGDPGLSWKLFLTTGILGGFTTFSAFSFDAAMLYQRGELMMALIYVLASVVLSILAFFAAFSIVSYC